MTALKLGKQPASHDRRDLRYADYAQRPPTPPAADTINAQRSIPWGMLGNDTAGDCVWAGGAHETMLWTLEGGKPATFDTKHVLGDYSAVTGYQADDPSTDQGTNVREALNYRRKTGLADHAGRRHKLGAYLALEPGNHVAVKEAVHLFDAVGIGFEFPASAMDQFQRGRPWTVVAGAQPDGGHYVPVVGYTSRWVYCVTWGKVQAMSWTFFAKYCDEAYALLSPEYLKGGKSPDGFDLKTLQADLSSLGG